MSKLFFTIFIFIKKTYSHIAIPVLMSPNLGPLEMIIKTLLVPFKILKTIYCLTFVTTELRTYGNCDLKKKEKKNS